MKLWVFEMFGYMAAMLTTVAYLPQALKTIKSKKTADISLIMYVVMFTGVICWLFYGFYLRSFPMMLANSVTLILISVILFLKLRYR